MKIMFDDSVRRVLSITLQLLVGAIINNITAIDLHHITHHNRVAAAAKAKARAYNKYTHFITYYVVRHKQIIAHAFAFHIIPLFIAIVLLDVIILLINN